MPVMKVRRSDERGKGEHGWLSSRHTFSFADYYDPEHLGFRKLRVINEDRVAPGKGFPTHAHRDMEILSYVLDGALAHQDSTGTRSVIVPGDVQRMSAGSGVTHSEYNHSDDKPLHFLQIWLLPEVRSVPPSYEQKHFPVEERRGQLRLVASREGHGAVTIHQDVRMYAALLAHGEAVIHELATARHAFLHVARGSATVTADERALQLRTGDAVAVSDARRLEIDGAGPGLAELLLFDLA